MKDSQCYALCAAFVVGCLCISGAPAFFGVLMMAIYSITSFICLVTKN